MSSSSNEGLFATTKVNKLRVLTLSIFIALASCGGVGSNTSTGTVTMNEYDWFGSQTYLGVIDVDLQPLTKRRLFHGSQPRFNDNDSKSGAYTFRQPCARIAHRIMMANASLQARAISLCNNTIPNPGALATDFGFSALSPDRTRLVVKTKTSEFAVGPRRMD